MAKITSEMKEVAENAHVFAIATSTRDGVPNVAAIRFGKVLSDDEILLVDNFMLKTRQNIEKNPRVAAEVWGKDIPKAFQFKGTARVELSGEIFDEATQWVKSINPKLSPKAAVIIKVDEIYVGTGGADAGKRVE